MMKKPDKLKETDKSKTDKDKSDKTDKNDKSVKTTTTSSKVANQGGKPPSNKDVSSSTTKNIRDSIEPSAKDVKKTTTNSNTTNTNNNIKQPAEVSKHTRTVSSSDQLVNKAKTDETKKNQKPITQEISSYSAYKIDLSESTEINSENSQINNDQNSYTSVNASAINSEFNLTDELKLQLFQKEQEVLKLRKVMNEKKELQDNLNLLRKERDSWRKKFEENDVLINSCLKELEDATGQIGKLKQDKDESTGKIFLAKEEVNKMSKELGDLKTRVSDLELDLEIKSEEYEMLKIELENSNSSKETESTRNALKQIENLDEGSSLAKIIELETHVNKLTNTLIKVTEDRNAEAIYYKCEIDKQNEKIKSLNSKLEEIPKKEEQLKQNKFRLKEAENLIEDLKEQLAVFTSASSMLDDLITQKTILEMDILREKEEKETLKNEMEMNDLLIQELENSAKISNEIVREKENEVLDIQNKLNVYKIKIEDNDTKEKQLINIITDLKNENKIIREEISRSKNVNVDEIINKNLNQKSRLCTLERQKVLTNLHSIDLSRMNLRNKIISTMIPKKIFLKGYIESFEKFLIIQTLRKKSLCLIFSIIENDILVPSDSTDIFESNKTMNLFLTNLLQTLFHFSTSLLQLEILLCSLNIEQLKTLSDLSKSPCSNLYMNISASGQFIDKLISMIKDDNFGVKYEYEGLRSIVKTITEESKIFFTWLEIDDTNFNKQHPILNYTSELLNYLLKMNLNYIKDKTHLNRDVAERVDKTLQTTYLQVKKTLNKFDEKFFSEILYSESSKIFDTENSYFTKLIENSNLISEEKERGTSINDETDKPLNENLSSKYDSLTEVVNKVCVVMLSFVEKYEKDYSAMKIDSEVDSSDNYISLPVKSWGELTSDVFNEIECNLKIKEDLEDVSNKLKSIKLEKTDLESKIEELARNKQVNDRKLGEAIITAGKVAQLESDIEEKNKKIDKYNTTIKALVENIESEQEKNKDLRGKLENASLNGIGIPRDSRSSKRGALITPAGNSSSSNPLNIRLSSTNNLITDSLPLLNTICELQRERKILKSKLMKEKLHELFNHNSYINRYISKNKTDNIEFYESVEENIQNLNINYKQTKRDLCLPKIYDLTDSDYNYEFRKKITENRAVKMRINYMQDIDKILSNMFGDHTLDKNFKDLIDNDISRTLDYYGEKRMLVGKIKIGDNNHSNNKSNAKVVPIFLSENALKIINKSFMH